MNNAIITTGRKNQSESINLAKMMAAKLNIPFVERRNFSINALLTNYNVKQVLIAKQNTLRLYTADDEIFFHPNMSHLRIKNILSGSGDRMAEAMNLKCGMKVLDCTLGLGADAIVASFIAGESGSVTAIEINPCLAAVVNYGLKHFDGERKHIIEAMRRIKVINADYSAFLKSTPDNSFDVVYFDPMFRHPLTNSNNLNPLRHVADHRAVTIEAVEHACRVAKSRVVLKENARSLEFARLGFDTIYGGKYSPIKYGVIIVN